MLHEIADRINRDYPHGVVAADGVTYGRARAHDGKLQLSANGGASWVDVDYRRCVLRCGASGRRVTFRRERWANRLMRWADYYVYLAGAWLAMSLFMLLMNELR